MPQIIGYTTGAFDLFHVGHLNLLRHARGMCDYLIAGVASDELLLERKGRLPVIPIEERLEIVKNIVFVDEAVVESHSNRLDEWRDHPFDVFFKGDDWKGTPKGIEMERQFNSVGVQVIYFPYTAHTSSTLLRTTLDRISNDFQPQRIAQ